MMVKVRVELQFFDGCPNHARMKDSLAEAVRGIEDKVDLIETAVEDDETATRLKFRGSPTLLIAGEDVDGGLLPEKGSRSCRLYPRGIPSAETIRHKIEDALTKE